MLVVGRAHCPPTALTTTSTYHGKKEIETGAWIKGDAFTRKLYHERHQYPLYHSQTHTYWRGACCKAKMTHSRDKQNNTQKQPDLGGQISTIHRGGRVGYCHWRLDFTGRVGSVIMNRLGWIGSGWCGCVAISSASVLVCVDGLLRRVSAKLLLVQCLVGFLPSIYHGGIISIVRGRRHSLRAVRRAGGVVGRLSGRQGGRGAADVCGFIGIAVEGPVAVGAGAGPWILVGRWLFKGIAHGVCTEEKEKKRSICLMKKKA